MDHKSAKTMMTISPGKEVHARNLTAEAHAGDLIPGIQDGQWEPCSREKDDRVFYFNDYEVMDGKIYSLGREGFVYDPKQNTWSSIKPIPSSRTLSRVAVVRDEFLVYDGRKADRFDDFLEFYHPGKDEWRAVESFRRPQKALFVAGGRIHSMSASEIQVYDGDEKTWTHLHSFAFAAHQSAEPLEVLVADTELLARVKRSTEERPNSSCVFRSIRFGGLNKDLHWQSVAVYPGLGRITARFFGPTISF
ncbi:unnamed protein product [Calypogeia fissa]